MGKMKYVIFTLIVIAIEFGISYLVNQMTSLHLLDAMFYVAIAFSVLFIFFSSSGGMTSNTNEAKVATSINGSKSNYQMNYSSFSLGLNPLVLGSVLFFVIGIVVSLLM
ncbi:hypothetical protein [Bacillus sp. AK128]